MVEFILLPNNDLLLGIVNKSFVIVISIVYNEARRKRFLYYVECFEIAKSKCLYFNLLSPLAVWWFFQHLRYTVRRFKYIFNHNSIWSRDILRIVFRRRTRGLLSDGRRLRCQRGSQWGWSKCAGPEGSSDHTDGKLLVYLCHGKYRTGNKIAWTP